MLEEEGLDQVFGRHARHAAATRAAVRAWGLDILCQDRAGLLARADGGDDAGRATTPTISGRLCWTASTCRWALGSPS